MDREIEIIKLRFEALRDVEYNVIWLFITVIALLISLLIRLEHTNLILTLIIITEIMLSIIIIIFMVIKNKLIKKLDFYNIKK